MSLPRKPLAPGAPQAVGAWRRWFVLGLLGVGALSVVSQRKKKKT